MRIRRASRRAALALALAFAPGAPADAWQLVVQQDFVPNATLLILGDGASRRETVTVSCVVDQATHAIVRLFVDVTAPPHAIEGTAPDTTIFIGEVGAAPSMLRAILVNRSSNRLLASADALGNTAMELLGWVEGLVDGGRIEVKIAAATETLAAFSIAGTGDSTAAAEFLAACVSPAPAP